MHLYPLHHLYTTQLFHRNRTGEFQYLRGMDIFKDNDMSYPQVKDIFMSYQTLDPEFGTREDAYYATQCVVQKSSKICVRRTAWFCMVIYELVSIEATVSTFYFFVRKD